MYKNFYLQILYLYYVFYRFRALNALYTVLNLCLCHYYFATFMSIIKRCLKELCMLVDVESRLVLGSVVDICTEVRHLTKV